MPKFLNLSQTQIRVLLAIVNFGIATACVVYLRISMREMRWSRSNKRFMIRNDQPELFVMKLVLGLLATVSTVVLGVLLLVPPSAKAFDFKFLQVKALHGESR